MNEATRSTFSPRVIAGLVLIALGVAFTLDSFGVIDAGSIGDYWPLFLIVPGIASLGWPQRTIDRFRGLILIAVGTLLLLRNLGIFWISLRHVWPVVLVAVGAYLVLRALDSRQEPPGGDGGGVGQRAHDAATAGLEPTRDPREPAGPSLGDKLNEFAMFGGGDRTIRSRSFRGGTVAAIMGGFDIDMRDAVMAADTATIDVFVMMGGIDLKVPESWTVVLDVTPFMGGANYSKRGPQASAGGPQKVLRVTGFVFMGGVDVKH